MVIDPSESESWQFCDDNFEVEDVINIMMIMPEKKKKYNDHYIMMRMIMMMIENGAEMSRLLHLDVDDDGFTSKYHI